MKEIMQDLTTHLFDYAGLFPPASLPLANALENYSYYQKHSYKDMLGKFILPIKKQKDYISQIREISKDKNTQTLPLSIILSPPKNENEFLSVLQNDCRLVKEIISQDNVSRIDAFETAFFKDFYKQQEAEIFECFHNLFDLISKAFQSADEDKKDFEFFCEIPYLENSLLHHFFTIVKSWNLENPGNQIYIKLRTGGITPNLVPSVENLSRVLYLIGEYRLPFKVTAGLHAPVPNLNSAVGTTMHGFLNVFFSGLLAFLRSEDGCGSHKNLNYETVSQVLKGLNYLHLGFEGHGIILNAPNDLQKKFVFDSDIIRNFRTNHFKGIGTCDFVEPIELLYSHWR